MLRLAKRRSRKPYHLLSAVHRRRLEKLERAARNEYECLQQKNLNIAKSFTQNLPVSKSLPLHKQTSRSPSPTTKSFARNIPSISKPLQHKQTLSQSPSSVQRNRLSPTKQNHEEWTNDEKTSCDITRSVKMIMAQLRRMEERQISIEDKIDKNAKAIKQLMQKSVVSRPVKPQGILFRTVDDFLAFEEVNEEIYNNLVGYFVYLGRANPVDCAAEYFRSVFPEDEEVSPYLTLNGRSGPGGCKLRDSRFAQACQDAINVNKHFPNPNNVEFYEALEKALKSLKTRKWRYNRKRQPSLHKENEEFPLNRRRRMDTRKDDMEFENTQEEADDANEPEESQYTKRAENVDEMFTQRMDESEDDSEDTQEEADDVNVPEESQCMEEFENVEETFTQNTDEIEDNIKDMDEAEYPDETEDNLDDNYTLEKTVQNKDLPVPLREQENFMEDETWT
ncbi:PREDICTED: uncharacterized protein LOC105563220, partial [Vollenhovia emeryi]|uniref:uncharacterized protein LOC105563220 n=1 Tax=Vollenhovia emeryi TaxID=411798 RepID=UPI0005F53266